MMKNVVLASLMLAVLMVVTPAAAFQSEVMQYLMAVNPKICSSGVTPEIESLFEAAVKALDAAGYGAGRESNFGGILDPETILARCGSGGVGGDSSAE
jgi:hypothetical protein